MMGNNLLFTLIVGILLMTQGTVVNGFLQLDHEKSTSPYKSEEHLNYLEGLFDLTVNNESATYKGLNLVRLSEPTSQPYQINNSYLAFLNMKGEFVMDPLYSPGRQFGDIEWINDTTIMTVFDKAPFLWNVQNNKTQQLDFLYDNQHHDFVYNQQTQTILALERYIHQSLNQTGYMTDYLLDKITEYDLEGNVMWEWFAGPYVNYTSYFENLVETKRSPKMLRYNGDKYEDVTHGNSLYWDYEDGEIVINFRHMNQFWIIDYNTKATTTIGENTEFTLINGKGVEVDDLFYATHDVHQVAEDEYIMFDNDQFNETSPVELGSKSSILRILIDFEKKEVREVFRYVAGEEYFCFFGGGADLLPNGNYLSSFTCSQHGTRDEPFHTDFGPVIMEVTNSSNVVWELRLPWNWRVSRAHRIVPILSLADQRTKLEFNRGEGASINWDAFGNFPERYELALDGLKYEDGHWDGQVFNFTIDTQGLDPGDHFLVLTISDLAGNSISKTAILSIIDNVSSKDDSPLQGWLLAILILPIVLKKVKKIQSDNVK